jgi:type I restriction enzyme M protein
MITGELKQKIDAIWDAFWSGGIANPLEVMEQITYLLFVRRLDDLQQVAENRANTTGGAIEKSVFPAGEDGVGQSYEDLRWSRFREMEPGGMFAVVSERVFPFLRTLGGDGSTYSHHMKDARFTIPTPALLARVVDMIDDLPLGNRDMKGDVYEYMLSRIATAGQNGQFRTPRHIISLMVELTDPAPDDEICDPACGTAGFLVAAADYIRREYPEVQHEKEPRRHFHNSMFHGFDFDSTMLRIGSMNMLLHDVENPDIRYRDSLSEGFGSEEGIYSLILANPPFAGSLDYETTAKNLLEVVRSKKTELLFLTLFLRLLKPGGRAAVIVPDGVLFGPTKAHKQLRRILIQEQKLDAVVKLPSGVFKPYSGVSTAILSFTKTDSGGTEQVWFYDLAADGFTLDDRRTALLSLDKLGPRPTAELTTGELTKNNLPDLLARWAKRESAERRRKRTEQSFCVPKAEIVGADYDLSISRYRQVEYRDEDHRVPLDILDAIHRMETKRKSDLRDLEQTLKQ